MKSLFRVVLYLAALAALLSGLRGAPPTGAAARPGTSFTHHPTAAPDSASAFHARFGRREPADPGGPTVQIVPPPTLTKQYELLLADPGAGYSNVLAVLDRYPIGNALLSDLFKDACVYVALRTQVGHWMREQEKDFLHMRTLTRETAKGDPAALEDLARTEADRREQWARLLSGYDAVFGERFRDCFGIDDPGVMEELRKLTLENAGPELSVPAPWDPLPEGPVGVKRSGPPPDTDLPSLQPPESTGK